MHRSQLGQAHRTAVVCIDSYDRGEIKGRLFHPGNSGAQHFESLSRMLLQIEKTLDSMAFPQSFNAVRTFSSAPPPVISKSSDGSMKGKLATFSVWILFRQNTSWQGNVRWLEGEREQNFRSALELIFLMDSALSGDSKSCAV